MSTGLVVTRFAPSPSGEVHLGNARTALFNFLLARKHHGRFVLRVEDTDASRTDEAHVEALRADLEWLGLRWSAGPGLGQPASEWRQSLRSGVYQPYYATLAAKGLAYPCFCTPLELDLSRRAQLAAGRPPRYAGSCRALDAAQRDQRLARGLRPTLRFRVPIGELVEFDDLVHGTQRFRTDDIGDFIIRRDNGTAAFFFCNAIDDAVMGITHVVRGEDHLSNTPRQLLLLSALDLAAPRYGHVSLITGSDGTPLSKRHGATTLRELRDQGFSADAIANQLFRLGHSTGVNAPLSLEQMAAAFDPAHLQRASAHFDLGQLRHWQSEWVRSLTPAQAAAWLRGWLPRDIGEVQLAAFLRAVLPNVVLAADAQQWARVILSDDLDFEPEALQAIAAAGPEFFDAAARAAALSAVPEVAAMRAATGCKGAAFFMPLRAALTGRLHGPELALLLAAMPGARIRARLAAHSQG
jgi:glutamyl-tRNA synthetase